MTSRDEVRSRGKRGQFIGIEPDIFDSENFDIYEKMVYFSLRRFMNSHTGEAYPGAKRLAKMSRCSERKVREAIKGLEEKGWISVERRKNNTNLYLILDGPGAFDPAHDAVPPAHGAVPLLHDMQDPPAQRADELDLYNQINNNYNAVFQRLYNLYQSKEIIKHNKPTQEMKDAVRSRLKSYSPEQLEQAINNYATVLKSHDHYFSYKYGFADLMRAKDVRKFVDEADPINNFRKKSFGQPPMQTVPPQPKPVDLDSLYTAGEDY